MAQNNKVSSKCLSQRLIPKLQCRRFYETTCSVHVFIKAVTRHLLHVVFSRPFSRFFSYLPIFPSSCPFTAPRLLLNPAEGLAALLALSSARSEAQRKPQMQITGNASSSCKLVLFLNNTVCLKKTSPTFLAVTRESIVGFSQYLAHTLPRKEAISRCYSFPPHLTSASALPEKMQ